MESKRVKITLPKNCEVDEVKTSVEDKFIVVEYTPKEKFKLKDGDIVYIKSNLREWIIIFQKESSLGVYGYCDFCPATKHLFINDNVLCHKNNIQELRPATISERTILFDALKENGLQWNAKEKNVRKVKPRGDRGNLYHYIGIDGETHLTSEKFDCMDDKLYNCNNYFLSHLEAEEYAQKIRSILKDR